MHKIPQLSYNQIYSYFFPLHIFAPGVRCELTTSCIISPPITTAFSSKKAATSNNPHHGQAYRDWYNILLSLLFLICGNEVLSVHPQFFLIHQKVTSNLINLSELESKLIIQYCIFLKTQPLQNRTNAKAAFAKPERVDYLSNMDIFYINDAESVVMIYPWEPYKYPHLIFDFANSKNFSK